MKVIPESTFALIPLQPGALKRDSGSIRGSSNWQQVGCPQVVREGQKVWTCSRVTWTLSGKRGTLTIREKNEWVDPGNDKSGCHIAFGTWKACAGEGSTQGSPVAGEVPMKRTATSGTRARRASSAFGSAPNETDECAWARCSVSAAGALVQPPASSSRSLIRR